MIDFTLDNDRIDYFTGKIGYDIAGYMDRLFEFMNENYTNIVNFYSGTAKEIKYVNFRKMSEILIESDNINSIMRANQKYLTTYLDWEIVNFFIDTRDQIYLTTKIDKFMRSSVTNTKFNDEYEFDYSLKQGQTLERISNNLQSDDYDNEWSGIALRNNLKETSYTPEGGNRIVLGVKLNSESANVRSIIDNAVGDKVLGKDVKRKITISDDDLLVLSTKETFTQTVDILSNLERTDNPEFLSSGLSKFVGNNINSFAFDSLIRQMTELFSTDDSIAEFVVEEIKLDKDTNSVYMKYMVSSRITNVSENGLIKL